MRKTRIKIRLPSDHHTVLLGIARREGHSLTALVLRFLRESLRPARVAPIEVERRTDDILLRARPK